MVVTPTLGALWCRGRKHVLAKTKEAKKSAGGCRRACIGTDSHNTPIFTEQSSLFMESRNIVFDSDDDTKNYLTIDDMDKLFVQFYNIERDRSAKGFKKMGISAEDLVHLCIFCVACALRPIEAFRSLVEDFDFRNKLLALPKTKTGFRRCKCSKWKKGNILLKSDKNCSKCHGLGKYRIVQYTTIWPLASLVLEQYFERKGFGPKDQPFPFYTKIFNNMLKEAGERAGLKILEVKDVRVIKNVTTYIFRHSCSRIMRDLKADRDLRDLKLRHKPDVQGRYDKYGINDLHKWEAENIIWPKWDNIEVVMKK